MQSTQLSIDTLDRAQERFIDTLDQMDVSQANTMPKPIIKSVTWLIWHTARMLDLQISELKGDDPLWTSAGWNDKFSLDLPDDTQDYKHTPEEAAKVKVNDKQLLKDYLDAAVKLTKDYLEAVKDDELDEVIDESWTPAVTRQVRIVSSIDDADMHSGQAVYTRRLVIDK
ncbi:DinB family protein [Tetragenococcus halophilus]|uniref:DinB family protein n=1 Tax=Tetragenococcus halophilus TaxID=51669 RepID=UPI001F16D285|nr:DinB family protein [Tetragenococcus halophilus]MCF1685157.1 DinB family protein [Tetragenococcus halophilus]